MSRKNFFGLFFLLFLTFPGVGQIPTQGNGFVVNPYVLNVSDNSFQVLWETALPTRGTILLGKLEYNTVKAVFKPVVSEESYSTMHCLTLTGLEKGQPYLYQVVTVNQSGDTLSGPVTDFTLPDYDRQAVTFTVVADTQGNPGVWGRIARQMYAERPSFIVHAGDLVSYGLNKDDWTDEFFRPAADLLRRYPLYAVLGNHEMNATYYYQYFNFPQPPSTGIRTSEGLDGDDSFIFRDSIDVLPVIRKGNVLMIFVNSNKDILPGSSQYRKLEKLLASSTDYWKIVVHHHPVYVSFPDNGFTRSPDGDVNMQHLRELYEDYGVDMVLNGHVHQYERTEPIFRGKIDRKKGVTYVTTGGGGGYQEEPASGKNWFDVRTRKVHHFLTFNIWENSLRAQAIDTSGKVVDFWEITKSKSSENPVWFADSIAHFTGKTTAIIKNNLGQKGKLFYKRAGEKIVHESVGSEVRVPVLTTTAITAWTVGASGAATRPVTKNYTRIPISKAEKNVASGKVVSEYYEDFFTKLPDFSRIKPLKSFTSDSLTLNTIRPRRKDHWAARFTGSFSIPETGVYRLLLRSYDGSKLWIDGKEIINNDGVHYEIFRQNFVGLEKGLHTFEVHYFDFTRRETLQFWMGQQSGKLSDFNNYLPR